MSNTLIYFSLELDTLYIGNMLKCLLYKQMILDFSIKILNQQKSQMGEKKAEQILKHPRFDFSSIA